MRRRQGATATEYMLVLSVIVVAIVLAAFFFVGPFRMGVLKLAQDVRGILAGENPNIGSREEVVSSTSCPYVFDSRPGRWHDPEAGYTMVPFRDAGDAGCK